MEPVAHTETTGKAVPQEEKIPSPGSQREALRGESVMSRELSVCSTVHPAVSGEVVQRRVKERDGQ